MGYILEQDRKGEKVYGVKSQYIKHTNVNTRGNAKTKFSLMARCTGKYLNSPLYIGAGLWDMLEKNIQDLPSQKKFTREIVKTQRTYIDLLG